MKWKVEVSQFPSIRVPYSSHCTSQLPSLETQPPTFVQQGHSAPQAPAACTQTCSSDVATPCCVDEIHTQTYTICLCMKSLNILKKTDIIQNLFFEQNGNDMDQVQRDVSRNSRIFGLYALTLK